MVVGVAVVAVVVLALVAVVVLLVVILTMIRLFVFFGHNEASCRRLCSPNVDRDNTLRESLLQIAAAKRGHSESVCMIGSAYKVGR